MKDVKMKIWAVLIGFYATTTIAGELILRDMYCDDTKTIAVELRDKYNEIPVVSGKASDMAGSTMTIWMNPASDSWTIVSTKDDFSCIIGVGEKLKVINYNKKKT